MNIKSHPVLLSVLAGFSPVTACATEMPPEAVASVGDDHPCKEDQVQSFVGRVSDEATLAAARRLSGSAILRIVKPGQPISMEYTTSRLTIEVDEKARIIRLYCG